MNKDLIKHIYHISEKYGGEKVELFTNHLKITGTICKCEDRDKSEYALTLMDAKIWKIDDLCKCGNDDCKCDEEKIYCSEWLNINIKKVVAFNIVKT